LEDDWSRTGTNLLWEEHDVIMLVHEKLHRRLGIVLLSPFSGGGNVQGEGRFVDVEADSTRRRMGRRTRGGDG
jgi:hypothetical protein